MKTKPIIVKTTSGEQFKLTANQLRQADKEYVAFYDYRTTKSQVRAALDCEFLPGGNLYSASVNVKAYYAENDEHVTEVFYGYVANGRLWIGCKCFGRKATATIREWATNGRKG